MRLRILAGIVLAFSAAAAQTVREPKHTPDVPFVPTTNPVVEAMLKLANVKKGDLVYDLGCGDGRIVIMAAKKYGARAVGVDINPERIDEATANAKKEGLGKTVRFEENDLFDANISNATVVTLYLLPDVNLRLRPKLLKELKPGTRIVSHSFDMGDWKPEKEETVEGATIYLWTVPPPK
jgi:SAM-dependent methyltransferase